MATRLKPTRINVDNTPRVWDGAAYQNDNDFHWSMGGWDMSYEDFAWHTLTGTSLVIEDISNNITPSSNFTVSAGTVKPGIEYVLRVNTGNTPYTMTLGTGVTNPNGYSTELTPNKVNQFKFIATSDSQLELEGVDTSEYLTWLTILSYWTSTWNDFITAYQKNAIVYCRASSNSNPATWAQNRLAFMAYVNNATSPTEVEFQYYRSRSSHGSDDNQQDEVYVYKLTSTSWWTWTVEIRDTAAKITTWTWLTKAYTTSWTKSTLTIANDGVLTVNGANGTVTVNDIKQSSTAPANPTAWTAWYDTTNWALKVYNWSAWDTIATGWSISDTTYGSAWDGQTTTAPSQNAVYDKISAMDTTISWKQDTLVSWTNIKTVNNNSLLGSWNLTLNDVKVSSTAPASPTEWMVWYDTTNDVLKTYNWASWDEAWGWGDVRVFAVPAVNDDISDMVARLSAWKWVILHEMVSWTDAFYKVDYHDDVTQEITASLLYSYNGGYARYYTIVYNYSTKKVSTKTSSLTYFFAPETAGTQWQVLTKTNSGYEWAAPQWTTYNAGEWIEIWTIQDYSAMQWPAPDGFHVPLNTEWQAVYDIWTALGGWSSDWTNFWIALKLPFAGYRFSSSAGVGSQGSYGFYWSSSRNNTNNAYLLNFNSSDVLPQNANYRAFGYSVRCFKNSPTVPTSSWTKLYWTSIEAWWIFWSSTEWLISMSSDWQTWITIQDKNLWATTVWNSWDTLSEANCWKYYQRWNNYWFPRTWSVTTSSTQVDASTYWPWNYYSSSTFITRNSSPYRWDTTDNWNLRWWETWVATYDNAIINTGVLSINWQTWNITIETFQLAPNSPLAPKYRRYWTQAQYDALTQYYTEVAGDTVYFTI